MDHNSFKTFSARPQDVDPAWHLVDAENQVVGRLAARVAALIRGKHKPEFTPHVDGGDFVVIVNADKARFTGKKETDKTYFRHSGYPGGVTTQTPREVREKHPERILERAVQGMLPKNRLGRQMAKKLKVYAGPDHPHEAQAPQPLDLDA
jgi:large subunit ribosomal protein L13